ncbi:SsrA-binding protein SmpB [Candidatus Uhrbacteria bacterium]|nr:SsrA-binding protein SmpB [Candidatus Uhrbacteria bacterium]
MPVIAVNKGALHDYAILETLEAGIVLSGQEVKSVRGGGVSLKGAYATLTGGEVWLLNAHISPYSHAGKLVGYDPTRSRKLLISKKQRDRLAGKLEAAGLTLVPLKVYTSKSRLKIELGLGRGKQKYEKRDLLKKRSVEKEIRQRLKR